MSMFDWQATPPNASPQNENGKAVTVTANFWMYWAVSVPLTFVVLLGWRIWWHHSKSYYKRKYPSAESKKQWR
jgi:hypothetical protein